MLRTYHPDLPQDSWTPDFLGGDLRARALPLAQVPTQPAVATLVHDAPGDRAPASVAVLYVHGWTDYFFNREMAEFFTAVGAEFYALDMHGSGRSLRPHQVPGYVADLREYFPDLDAAAAFIRAEHPELPLVILAHSQGGLTAALWARERASEGLILNAPWLDLPHSPAARALLTPAAEVWGWIAPRAMVPIPSPRLYEQVISADFGGEWRINDEWRPDPRAPSRPGWARAILRAQNELSQGLGLTLPTLTITSHASLISTRWREEMRHLDIVTDVRRTWRRVPLLGTNFEIIKVRGAVHDVLLSEPGVRARAYQEIREWLARYRFIGEHSFSGNDASLTRSPTGIGESRTRRSR